MQYVPVVVVVVVIVIVVIIVVGGVVSDVQKHINRGSILTT